MSIQLDMNRLPPHYDESKIRSFIRRWEASSASERANKDLFFVELCQLLGVEPPSPKGVDNDYVFEKDVLIEHTDGSKTTCFIDVYKRGHFVLEAKQGGEKGEAKGTATRHTLGWAKAMEKAFAQAKKYAVYLPEGRPPFLITCDIGYCFELWAGFDRDYGGYGARRTVKLDELLTPDTFALFQDIFTNPEARNPAKLAARVTRQVAARIAELAKSLEAEHDSVLVARFLMRCLFTMFSEDVGLLPEKVFTKALQERWYSEPERFVPEVQQLWAAMDKGTVFGFEKLPRFNGNLFADADAIPLNEAQLELLEAAAICDWGKVEPAIFGTLLERALNPKERHRLGAHYTPRAYIERLAQVVVEEPLRAEWQTIEGEVRQLLDTAENAPIAKTVKNPEATREKRKRDARDKAVALIQDFHRRLAAVKVLDPACGSGNFLYVTFDLLKRLELEVLRRLNDLGHHQMMLEMAQVTVHPSQFLGLEVKPWAREIAEMVIWIGYLQWHHRVWGLRNPPEPILRDLHNVEGRDAVLAYTDREEDRDPNTGLLRTRWDGETFVTHPATSLQVPDDKARVASHRYLGTSPAEWPDADFIIGNPPFIGASNMRRLLGDGYTEALRETYPDVPESADFVMYWWYKAAELVRTGQVKRFGFITTNSISQTFNRRVIEHHLNAKKPLRILWAIPDHPWVDSDDGAAVRIAMTCGAPESDPAPARLLTVNAEEETAGDDAVSVELTGGVVGVIHANLRAGANVTGAVPLRANKGLSCPGVKLHGAGFIVAREEARAWGWDPQNNSQMALARVIKPYRNGRDLMAKSRDALVIDFYGLTVEEAATFPQPFQRVLERVKPERDTNNREYRKRNWWLFGENIPAFRPALSGLARYIVTVETAKHRVFQFLSADILPDNMLIAIASESPALLGVLSSRFHVVWALAAGGRLGVGNDPRYNKSRCFEPFPFPILGGEQAQRIGGIAERLDSLRKQVQEQHADVTLTGMYNVLEKLRSGEVLTSKEQVINQQAQVSVLLHLHKELDAAVAEAYGWSTELTDEQILENVVQLNAERAALEREGIVYWLRPDYQNPSGSVGGQVVESTEEKESTEAEVLAAAQVPNWPTKTGQQLAAIRELFHRSHDVAWTVRQVAQQFKGAPEDKVLIDLETWEDLGLLIRFDADGEERWQLA